MTERNQRNSKRATVNMLVGETKGGTYFMPLLANLSESGLMVENPAGLEQADEKDTFMELMLPGCSDIIWARCKQVRKSCHGFFQARAYKFVNISAVDRKQIRAYLQRCVGLT